MHESEQPVVILGGFLGVPGTYRSMRETLAHMTAQPMCTVATSIQDWLRSTTPAGWADFLGKLDRTVQRCALHSPTGKVILVVHSSGGVMARLYLGDRPFLGQVFGGTRIVDGLITLGSPHHNLRVVEMRRWVDEQYPGAYYLPIVQYSCVAGRRVQGRRHGSIAQRFAYLAYHRLSGLGETWGDGLVPIASAMLQGARPLVLDGVSHFALSQMLWYGSAAVVPRWWDACSSGQGAQGD